MRSPEVSMFRIGRQAGQSRPVVPAGIAGGLEREQALQLHGAGTEFGAGAYAGSCIRVDRSMVIAMESDCLPLRIVPDESLRSRAW